MSTGRDETPDEALQAKATFAVHQSLLDDGIVGTLRESRHAADAVLAVVLSPKRDEQLRQEGRTEVWRHIADAPQQKSGSW